MNEYQCLVTLVCYAPETLVIYNTGQQIPTFSDNVDEISSFFF
jgi:hypothetical protein